MSADTPSVLITLFLIFSAALGGGVLAQKLKMPQVVGYILSGIVVGNIFPRVLDTHFLDFMADWGVTLLMFTVGLEFSITKLSKILKSVFLPAISQIFLTILFMFLFSLIFGFPFISSLFISLAASLSSTAIVVKLLSEKGELETDSGKIMTGWLVVQDLAVVPFMVILSAVVMLSANPNLSFASIVWSVLAAVVKSAVLILAILWLGKRIVPPVFTAIANLRNREIFTVFTVGFILINAYVSYIWGLSAPMGAFISGILVSQIALNHAIFAEVRPLRDLFAVVFFVSIGLVIPLSYLFNSFWMLLSFILFLFVVKGAVIYFLSRYINLHPKVAFLTTLGLIEMSEFGFIIAKTGLNTQAINQETYLFITVFTFMSIIITAPLLYYSQKLYYALHLKFGKVFPLSGHKTILPAGDGGVEMTGHAVICGYGRVGKYIGRALAMVKIPFLVVDINAKTVNELRQKGITAIYGDPAEPDVLDYAQVDLAKLVIIAIPDRHTQELVITNCLSLNRHVKIICRTHREEDQSLLKSLGVHTIVQPEFEAALTIIYKLFDDFNIDRTDAQGKISRLKIEHGIV